MTVRALRLPLTFDADAILSELSAIDEGEWVDHAPSAYHDGGWSGIALRSPDGAATTISDGDGAASAQDTPLLARLPQLTAALAEIGAPIRAIRVMRLAPGAELREHRDEGMNSERGAARLHVPLQTNDALAFTIEGERVVMRPGECWYVNVDRPHRIVNRGTNARIHLVIDCVVNAWLDERFRTALAAEPAAAAARPFAAFRELVLHDPALQAELAAVDETQAFLAACIEAGVRAGAAFTADELIAVMRANQLAWLQRRVIGADA